MEWYFRGLLVVLGLFFVFEGGFCCGANWLRFGDRCFRFYSRKAPFPIAWTTCHLEGGDLASISNDSVLHFIAQHAAHEEGDRFWVGLTTDPETGQWSWADGTSHEQPWVSVETNLDNKSGSLCSAYNGALVVQVPCNQWLGAVCERSIPNRRNRTVCNVPVDPVHSFVGDATGNCLFRPPAQTSKRGVEELCQTYGGNFTDLDDMVKDGLTAFYDHQVLSNDGSRYWTGFTWNGTDMFWSSGNSVSRGYPISVIAGNGSCITVQFNFTDILQTHFYPTDCRDNANVVCSKRFGEILQAKTEAPTTSTPTHRPLMDSSELKCPEGYNWKVDSRTNYCYWETSYETEHLSWSDAEMYCRSYGGHLASFHTQDEEKIGLSFQYGSLSHPYWIGLSLDVETETYKWSDGSPLDYTNWAPGHPNHRDKRLKCVAMEAQQKNWVSSLCGILSWFICKVPKQTRHYTAMRPTPTPLEPCEELSRGSLMSYRFQGSCYRAVTQSSSWHQAKQYCEGEGASLVSIHSGDEIGFLLKLLQASPTGSSRVWIGLNSFGTDGSFQWTDWSPVDFTFFANSTSTTVQFQEKCCNMYIRNGQWSNENCNADMSFVCKWGNESASTLPVPTTADPRKGNCKKGWVAYDDRCYYFGGTREKDRVNWTKAARICRSEGGDLTSIRGDREQAFLSYMLQSLGVDAWIGFHDKIISGRYFWLDSSEVKYTNWAIGEPSFFGITEDCVKMIYDHQDSGVWKDEDCDERYGYICQSRRDPELPKPSYELTTACLQPEGWLKLDSMCFRMFEGEARTWKEAERACQKEGGHLVSVSDQRVKAAVSHLAVQLNRDFFIGLRYKKTEKKVSWLNDFPVLLTNWEKNEPSLLDEDTCFVSTSEGYWKKAPCDEQMPFMCQIASAKNSKQSYYTGNCPVPSGQWTPGRGSNCYLLENGPRVDWFTANLMCHRHATHLVSIHSNGELEDLRELLQGTSTSIFIGLMKNKKGGFTWMDDSPVDFVNWAEGEPSSHDEQCVEMMADTMKWRVTSCIFKRRYVCQDRKDTLVYQNVHSAEYTDAQSQAQLSSGAIWAIVVSAAVVLLLLLAAAVFYRRRNSEGSRFRRHDNVSFENALYKAGSTNMEF